MVGERVGVGEGGAVGVDAEVGRGVLVAVAVGVFGRVGAGVLGWVGVGGGATVKRGGVCRGMRVGGVAQAPEAHQHVHRKRMHLYFINVYFCDGLW